MLNKLPVLGWLLDLFIKASIAFPFWIAWTVCGVGRDFFGFLPAQFHAPSFWATVGIFICLGTLRALSPFCVKVGIPDAFSDLLSELEATLTAEEDDKADKKDGKKS